MKTKITKGNIFICFFIFTLISLFGCKADESETGQTQLGNNDSSNKPRIHDPSELQYENGHFMIFSTGIGIHSWYCDIKTGVWKLAGGKPTIHVRGEKRFRTPLNAARCLTFDPKGLLVGDSASTSVLRIAAGAAAPAHEGRIGIPTALATNKGGDTFVADLDLRRIWKLPAAGGKPVEFAKTAAPFAS